ncbi:cation acetate symporter [Amycolatopsis sp. cg5]|uniref:sodium/solute symporter n=1 Tax=Amycolatopsis sp. cg5 TaxID=3238802 RepID=UPI003524565D
MNNAYSIVAVVLVVLATLSIGIYGLRFSRTTSDFYVASRTVSPQLNGSAISGEYLSAASFLGVAGLLFAFGSDMLWYPVGYTVGYLFLAALVAAPLRRSGAYTLPDFAEARLESRTVRRIAGVLTVGIGWIYLLPQLQGASLTLATVTGAPKWAGGLLVVVVVVSNVVAGGMRSITFVQAFQYWFKLTALAVPLIFLVCAWLMHGKPKPEGGLGSETDRFSPFNGMQEYPVYVIYALMIATFLGTMGLPHVVVRFYTNPSGREARRTTVVVLALLGIFYVMPPVYAALGRMYNPNLPSDGNTDAIVLLLPRWMIGGVGGDLLGALLAGGAFAAFLSTSSGLMVSVAGVLSGARNVRAFRLATIVAAAVPFAITLLVPGLPAANVVGLAFAVAASSFCPLLVLGIWWRKLTSVGAAAGLITGGGSALVAGAVTIARGPETGLLHTLLAWPAAWSVPLGFGVMVVVSLLTPQHRAPGAARMLARLHLPESLLEGNKRA